MRGRMQRVNSYSHFAGGPRPDLSSPHGGPPRHPNQGLQLEQVAEDEPIENKLVLPDDMVHYLSQVRS